MTTTPHVTIVLPCYNEQDHVINEVERICKAMDDSVHTYELLAVDDCSTDDARTATENEHAQGGDNASLSSLSVYTSPTGEATDVEGEEKEPKETAVPLSEGSESESDSKLPAAKSS